MTARLPRARLLGRPLYMRIPSPINTTSHWSGVPTAAQTQGQSGPHTGLWGNAALGGSGLRWLCGQPLPPSGTLESQMGEGESPAHRRM